ncbi:zinc ABC transporter substrate-binding protein [Hazenella sp. IB182353]|uniref:metal ABC transporter solute-binding protein, Zn/Mn family n=1 Tax=Polycladospora coralii TaxID=2771432 RepID=UPI001745FAAB|nr:zinc ABC transporter substrate-binding protein [Polycladospora coralii]MBS7531661.1 zinc ABC transporter substrate-binding protein [Polycladospora coralii]
MKGNRLYYILGIIMILSIITACDSDVTNDEGADVIQVTATTGMIADTVKNVGGEHVSVTGLMGPGVDPHLYKASQGDIGKLDQADVIFYNGLLLEGKMQEILEKMGKHKEVIAIADHMNKNNLMETADKQIDPHIWFDVKLWIQATEKVKEGLIQVDPTHKADYEQQAAQYLEQLKELDTYASEQLATIPEEQRVLVTAHDAFGYFGRAYEVEVVGLQGISTASEYGLKDVKQIVDLLVERKIKAVFVESSVPKRSIEAVVQGAKEQGHEVIIGGELFSDAMGSPGTKEGTYIGMVRHNVDTIVKSLK